MTAENKQFANASNARRAARADGLTLDQIEIKQHGAKFYYVKIAQEENAMIEETTATRTLILTAADGSSYGEVSEADHQNMAVALANDEKTKIMVIVRETGEVVLSVEPHSETTTETVADQQVEVMGEGATESPGDIDTGTAEDRFQGEVEAPAAVMLAVEVSAHQAAVLAEMIAKLTRGPVMIAETTPLQILNVIEPKAAKVKATSSASVTKARKTAPDGKKAEVLRLCCRETGASPAELIAATGWDKAPWKWMLRSNPKDNLCDKYGYEYAEAKDGNRVRYLLTKIEAPAMAEAA